MKKKSILILCAALASLPAFAENIGSATGHSNLATDPHFNFAKGYLSQQELPNSLELLTPPPDKNSSAFQRDEEARRDAQKIKNTLRWQEAIKDADLTFPAPAEDFSSVMGFQISENATPHIYTLMRRVLTDAGLSTYGAKNKYFRERPFVVHQEGTCQPSQEEILRGDGSYPSGHTAAGWAWALVLAEVNPSQANAILKKGIDFGNSRIICNAHWQSDVDAGRIMGAATVAKLHNNEEFISDIAAAKNEAIQMLSVQSQQTKK